MAREAIWDAKVENYWQHLQGRQFGTLRLEITNSEHLAREAVWDTKIGNYRQQILAREAICNTKIGNYQQVGLARELVTQVCLVWWLSLYRSLCLKLQVPVSEIKSCVCCYTFDFICAMYGGWAFVGPCVPDTVRCMLLQCWVLAQTSTLQCWTADLSRLPLLHASVFGKHVLSSCCVTSIHLFYWFFFFSFFLFFFFVFVLWSVLCWCLWLVISCPEFDVFKVVLVDYWHLVLLDILV